MLFWMTLIGRYLSSSLWTLWFPAPAEDQVKLILISMIIVNQIKLPRIKS